LRAGQKVEGIGGPDFFGRLYSYAEAQSAKGIPMGLTAGGTVLEDIGKDEMFTEENFSPDSSQFVHKLRQMQDALPA
jgi:predicted homoserine dehydrogenase-like protein